MFGKDGIGNLIEIKTNYKYSKTNPGQGNSVLLPLTPYSNPSYHAKILLIGGAGSNNPNINTYATNTVEILDLIKNSRLEKCKSYV